MSRHDDLIVIDGLIVANWGPGVFEALRAGGITATNATCAVWEGARHTLDNIAQWLQWFDTHRDLITPVRAVADVAAAKAAGRTGIILGFQNGSPIEDRLDYLALYKRLGVGIIQLTYNTQNLIGSGCYESRDSGLSDFGREVVAEMNRVGIAVDLSHVGARTSDDAIECSRDPVVFSHVLPAELKQHPRNKETRQLKAVADRGGLVGVTMFPPFLPKGTASTVDDYAGIIEWMVDRLGEDHVAYGTDFTEGHDERFFEWITRDKGDGRWLTKFGEVRNPRGIERIEETPNLTAALERRGFKAARIEKVMGRNWISYLERVWHE
ncbi:MAG: membrane dipeptidase [Candidatus Rokubacteria bacterium]|nr:membrane dipeptidase [Candidatus Rokubacteria bacterium]